MNDAQRPGGRLTGVSAVFDGSRLTLARQLAGLRKVDLADLITMTPASVSAWESGSTRPNAAAVAKLALALEVEPRFFSATGRSELVPSPPHFRSLRSTTQLSQDQAFAYGRLVAEIVEVLEKTVEFPEFNLPELPLRNDDPMWPEKAARATREHLGLDVGPVPNLIRLAERAGVIVVFSAPQTASIDAFSLVVEGRRIIVLNPDKDDYYRQRFDVAHEIGHLVMHADTEPGSRVAEDQAHRFASELLMPAEQILPSLPRTTTGRGWERLAQLKEHWGVSIQALLYRSKSLGVMSDVTYRNAMIRVSSLGWRRAEPGQVVVVEMPSLIPKAIEVLQEVGVSAKELVRGTGLPLPVFQMIAARAPGAGLVESVDSDDARGLVTALSRRSADRTEVN